MLKLSQEAELCSKEAGYLEHNLSKNVSNESLFCDKCKFKRFNMA